MQHFGFQVQRWLLDRALYLVVFGRLFPSFLLFVNLGQVQKLVNNWLVATSFSIGVADTVADTETIMAIGNIIDTAKR